MRDLLWPLVTILSLADATSVFFVDDDDQTLSFPLQGRSVQQFENDILNILGIEDPPESIHHSNVKEIPTRYMKELFHSMQQSGGSSDSELERMMEAGEAEMVVSLIPKAISRSSKWDRVSELEFTVEDSMKRSELLTARLFFLPSLPTSIHRVAAMEEIDGSLKEISSSTLPMRGIYQISLNISSVFMDWQKSSRADLLLAIETSDARLGEEDWTAFVMASFEKVPKAQFERRSSRERRSIESPIKDSPAQNPFLSKRGRRTACRKHGLYVDFQDMGWKSWVVAPQGYEAHYCSGACSFPLTSTMNATNHALVQTLVHMVHRRRASEASCAPLTLAPLSVVFFDNKNNIVLKQYRDMIVQDCGCQ